MSIDGLGCVKFVQMEFLRHFLNQPNKVVVDCNDSMRQNNKSFSRVAYGILQQEPPKDLQKGQELGHKIFALGTDLKHMRVTVKALSKLDELDEIPSKIDWLEGKKLMWALKPTMLALIQHKFFGETCKGIRLLVASCLIYIMKLTGVFKLIVETFQDLDNSAGSTFGKKLEVLEITAMTSTYEIMFDLECDDLI